MLDRELGITGNIGNDARVNTVGENLAIGFNVATTEKFKNKQGEKIENTIWVQCTIWRKIGQDNISMHLKKGQLISLRGTPFVRAYMDKQNPPQPKGVLELRVDEFKFRSTKPNTNTPSHVPGETSAPVSDNAGKGEDDLPF